MTMVLPDDTSSSSDQSEPATLQALTRPILSEEERHTVLIEWNNTQTHYSRDLCIQQLFEASVERTPQAIAAVCQGQGLTYQELNAQANQLAHHLKTLGVGPGAMVAIYLERSLDMLVAMLGILKAGGTYVPLETSYPQARVQWILSSLHIPILITHMALLPRVPETQYVPRLVDVICLDSAESLETGHESKRRLWTRFQLERFPQANLPCQISAQDIAYCIFTSGSTGTPKGVAVCHQSVINLIEWVNTTFHVQATDRVLFVTSICFDLSVYDVFGLLAAGGSICIATEEDLRDPERLLALLYQEPITFWDSAPAALGQLVPFFHVNSPHVPGTDRLRLVFLSGDWIPVKLPEAVRTAFPEAHVISLGGATEATIWSNYYAIEAVDPRWVSIPYGKPIQNARYYILDAHLDPCPVGVAGDLYIGGECLSIGYIQAAGITAEKFLPDPYSGVAGSRMYTTGDLARFWSDGTMEFLGRVDQQVKVRGFRIELGEIETVLSQHPALQDVVVIAREYAEREKRLLAYLVPNHERAFPVRQLLHFEQTGLLADKQLYELPNGMVILHQNRGETDFLYNELYAGEGGLKYGITVQAGDCIFDVGAHIGLFSLLVGQACNDLELYAFEPIPSVFEVLRLNSDLYGLHTKLFNFGLGKTSATETFTYYPHVSLLSGRFANKLEEREIVKAFLLNQQEGDTATAALSDEELDELLEERLRSEQITCQVKTLSEVMREQQVERIDLLKIDVEKSEHEVLAGIDEQDWPKIRQVMVEVSDIDHRLEQITGLLKGYGFELTIEQETSLKKTRLYNVYARRPAQRDPARCAGDEAVADVQLPDARSTWCSKTALINDVRSFLKEHLPEYMLPSAFILLDALPLTSNGKVNRKALPDPQQEQGGAADDFIAPRTGLEVTLATLWASMLGLKRVSITDNFFELGGHSLLATQVITRVRDIYQIDLPLPSLFKAPTIASLATLIEAEQQKAQGQSIFHIQPVARTSGSYPLSFSQEQVWFLQQIDASNMAYNFQATLKITGPLNVPVLERSLSEIIRRHEIYRTTFEAVDGQPVQIIQGAWPVKLAVTDLVFLPLHERATVAERATMQEFRRPFELSRLPLIRWSLLRLDIEEYILIHVEHHFVHDGWSFNIFLHELLTLYQAFSNNLPSPLADLPVQFVDFVNWQRRWVGQLGDDQGQSELAQKQLRYWKERLSGSPPVLKLPMDRPRPAVQTFRGHAVRRELPLALCEALRAHCRKEGFTLYMVMLAAFLTLLHRYSGQEDICLGTGIANRRSREAEQLIGMLINILVLRTDLSGNPSFRELLQRVREVTLEAYAQQDLPFEKVVEALNPQRTLRYNPLFQVIFAFHDSPLVALEVPGLTFQLEEGLNNGSAKFDLNIIVIPRSEQYVGQGNSGTRLTREAEGMTLLWEYNTDLFDERTMSRMIAHYQILLEKIVTDPEQHIEDVIFLMEDERRKVLEEWNATEADYAKNVCIHDLFEAQVRRTPESVALADGDTGERQLSYRELNRRANQLAYHLRKLGVGPEVRVGICMERGLELVIGMLGVLKAAGAFVPLDPAYPAERLTFMLTDAQAAGHPTDSRRVVLTQERLRATFPEQEMKVVCIDSDWTAVEREREENPAWHVESANLAYVIYTSGSTGRPKGVAIQHASLVNLACWHQSAFQVTMADRASQVAGPAFDASVWEVWPYLISGASVHLPEDETRLSPLKLKNWLLAQAITISFLPTALAEIVLSEDWSVDVTLRALLTGGDRLQHAPRRTLPFSFVNNYGPTENTVVTTSGVVLAQEQAEAAPPIGRPIANTQVYVLDVHMQLVPIGVPGELYIGGTGLARGYLNQPGLTAERFVPDPFSQTPGGRLYKTGDFVRSLPDGSLEFRGRNDGQVKIRGFRIELGEIEMVLASHPAVLECVVLAQEDVQGEKRLVSYVVPRPAMASTVQALRAYVKQHLPDSMVPTNVIFLDALPLTPNGKLDRAALPASDQEHSQKKEMPTAPRTPLERSLGEIWADVLGLQQVSISENFFELGGHSLLATRFIARVWTSLQIDIGLRVFFEHPTLASLAEAIGKGVQGDGLPSAPAITPIARRARHKPVPG